MLAPIFVPLFIRLGVAPQTVLAAYRVGDSPVNVITPLMAYFPLIVIFVQRYQKDSGIGTVVSLMLPYVFFLSIVWTAFFVAWYLIGIPLGPGRLCTPDDVSTSLTRMSDSTICFVILGVDGRALRLGLLPRRSSWQSVSRSRSRRRASSTSTQSLAGFGDPTVIFIASLFVVSAGLDSTGVTAWAGQRLIDAAGESRTRLRRAHDAARRRADGADQRQWLGRSADAVVVMLAVRLGRPPRSCCCRSRSARTRVAAHADGHACQRDRLECLATNAGVGTFGFFEFALVGIPLLARHDRDRRPLRRAPAATPQRRGDPPRPQPPRPHARSRVPARADPGALVTRSSGIAEVVVPPRSDLVGATVYPGMVTDSGDLIVLAVQRRGEALDDATALAAGDALLLRGTWGALEAVSRPTLTSSSSMRPSSCGARACRSGRGRSARSQCSSAW